jgi:putative flippase GtrA
MSPRRHGILRIGRFSIVGVLNTLVDLTVFLLLVELVSMPVVPANLLAFSVALANSYVLNRLWTFHDSGTAPSLGNVSRFVLFNACGALLATAALALLVGLGLPTLAAKLLSIVVSMAWNYLTMRHFVFRPGR